MIEINEYLLAQIDHQTLDVYDDYWDCFVEAISLTHPRKGVSNVARRNNPRFLLEDAEKKLKQGIELMKSKISTYEIHTYTNGKVKVTEIIVHTKGVSFRFKIDTHEIHKLIKNRNMKEELTKHTCGTTLDKTCVIVPGKCIV